VSAVPKKNKRNRQPASQGSARHSGEKRVAQIGHWESTTTGELCEFITSGSRDWKSYYSDTGAYFIRTQDINRDHLDLSNAARVKLPDRVEGKRSRVLPGDLLITITGANVGKVALVPDQIEEAYVSQSVGLMRLKDKRFAPYLHYYLQSEECGRKQVLGLVYGIGRPVLSLQNLRDIPVVLPPLDAQRKIIAEIEKQSTRLDSGVAALRRVQANLKRYRAAVLKAACEGRLVPTEAELARTEGRTYETGEQLLARILADRRKNWRGRGKYKELAAPVTTNLPPLPDGWVWATCAQIGEAITGFTPPKSNPEFFGGDVPFFKPTDLDAGYNVREFRDSLTEAGALHGRVLPPQSILVTCIGATIGKTGLARVRCATNQQINALVVSEEPVSPKYVYWYFCGPLGQRQILDNASATTLPILNKSRFEALPIPLPPLVEQERIVAEVERRLSVIDELETAVTANLQRAARLRQSVLQRAFSEQ
jgi:type I restriction enzyme S subunit